MNDFEGGIVDQLEAAVSTCMNLADAPLRRLSRLILQLFKSAAERTREREIEAVLND